MYGAVHWINDNPVLNGMPIFDTKEACLKYIDEYKEVDKQFPDFNIRWTIIELRKQDDKRCKIFGSEISFELFVPTEDIKDVCQDIWDNPDKYSDYKKGSESAYYKFLKFLWVEYPDGSEDRLVDLVDMEKK